MSTGRDDDTGRFDAATVVGGLGADARSVNCSAEQAMTLTVAPGSDGSGHMVPPSPEVRYSDEGEIGRGGMGMVRRVFDRILMRPVAMKLIDPSLLGSSAAELFVEEAQITGQLDHPNIVPVHEFGVSADHRAFFTMKLVSGQTLGGVIADLHAAPPSADALERVLHMLVKVCEAVSFAHSRGVVHRDLKPANIMIGTHGQVYVMDWGLGHLVGTAASPAGGPETSSSSIRSSGRRHRAGGELVGTIAYMAPEQALGNTAGIDGRTDVFALGAILYEVLTGRPPYQAATRNEGLLLAAGATVTPPQQVTARPLPPGLCDIAMKAMRAEREDRFQTVEALREELEACLRHGGWFATRRFRAGELIVREGDAGDAVMIVVEGRCEAFRDQGGQRVHLRHLGPGDVFGETALISERPRTASVLAVDDVIVKVVTPEAFGRELDRNTWQGSLVRQLTSRLLEMEQRRSD
jgi:eukaryotic-like serine/threonine-protein kinase